MGSLVCNGSKLYRRDSSLVRSPIYKIITLAPSEMAYYPLCGDYAQAGSDMSPARGYHSTIGLTTKGDAIQQGKYMRKAYKGVNASTYQDWWRSTVVPRFVFLHGRYGVTTASSTCCEAYMQVPACKFTIPSQYSSMTVAGVSLGITHYGTILEHTTAGSEYTGGSSRYWAYYANEAPTTLLNSDSDWRNKWTMRVGIHSSLNKKIITMHNAQTDDIILDTNNVVNDLRWTQSGETHSKTNRFSPLIGNISVSYHDDGIPCTFHPWNQTVTLSQSITNSLNSSRTGWIMISPNVSYSTGSTDTANDYPCYYCDYVNRWLCCSFGQYTLQVRLLIA